jgi:hypothetical protein
MRGYWKQQWSNMWADNYTSSEYVVFFDSDAVLHILITPDMVFDSQGRVVHTISKFQHGEYCNGSSFWLGDIYDKNHPNNTSYQQSKEEQHWPGNFMIRLPLVFPTKMFPAFRDYIINSGIHQMWVYNTITNKTESKPYPYFDLFNYDYVNK